MTLPAAVVVSETAARVSARVVKAAGREDSGPPPPVRTSARVRVWQQGRNQTHVLTPNPGKWVINRLCPPTVPTTRFARFEGGPFTTRPRVNKHGLWPCCSYRGLRLARLYTPAP